ncbi:MAG: penicillin-binding transpeptidase domain-containing protein, partial [Lachnospiraceae bacterium]|nr:penicillin-binding transpeptidase domain-containing protein [Lachnospiraceae bacterium]
MARRRVEPVPPPGRIEREERERAERRREEEARRIGEADIKRRRAEYKKARKDEEMLLAAAKRKKNRPYLFISGAFLLLFISLIGYLAYFNVVMRDRILANPYNKRQETLNEYVIRGDIVSRDGEVLAHTEIGEDGNETRVYPYGRTFAHIVGFSVKGRSGIESIKNYDLLSSHNAVVDRILNEFEGTRNPGDIIVTSLDTDVQSAACSALGDRQGAVVVMRPSSGEVYAMVSKPDFDPNTIDADWEAIVGDETGSQLLNRALQGLYPPGSTFKIVTALGYMR